MCVHVRVRFYGARVREVALHLQNVLPPHASGASQLQPGLCSEDGTEKMQALQGAVVSLGSPGLLTHGAP